MARDPEILSHQEWIGYIQPVGLVVSPPALVAAQAFPSKNIIPEHARFLDLVEQVTLDGQHDPQPAIRDFPRFATQILGWEPSDLLGSEEGQAGVPNSLEVALPEYNETLRPSYAVPEFDKDTSGNPKWLMLVQRVKLGLDLDETPENDEKDHRWHASPQARFERLLRETQVPIGLLSNGTQLRLVYAPRGETSGHATFRVRDMAEVAGRPIFAALLMLLSAERLFTLPDKKRLPHILAESRKYQNLVSTKLAEQVLAALYELLRGFQAADDQRHGDLLRDVLKNDPNQVYGGLLRVLLRLVFILFAEDRSLLSTNEVYQKYYSVLGLFERLREDAGRYTDTMDHRFGAWTQLLTLFRLIYNGGRHGGMKLLPRKGYLFDPDRYPFLEGRPLGSTREPGERMEPPRVSDGVVFRVLQNLLILDGERLSYRTLDVEQIGSVYETMMGFNLEVARGRSIAIKPTKAHGAPATINLEELLATKPADRAKWLKEQTDQSLTGQAATALKDAKTPEDAVAALEKKLAREATPNIVPPGAMVLQPSDERRKSGSHYTPRSLTEPIVRTTLRPILERLGPDATPGQILDLKVCDPAMGSGAFLVEACRQLAEVLVKAWHAHDCVPTIPPDEDEVLHARRIVAQRCLYGVDKNPMAVDLAKLSLWLATLAKDHPFTFVDHALRFGDSLVGLSRKQIEAFHWKPELQRDFSRTIIADRISRAMAYRREIREAAEATPETLLSQKLALADEALNPLRFYGDLVIAAFFAGANDRQRKGKLDETAEQLSVYLHNAHKIELRNPLEEARRSLVEGDKPVHPFHWEIEFPEVFDREQQGFDAVVGNPPFLGGLRISSTLGAGMLEYLKSAHEGAGHLCDVVAHFFRLAFRLLRQGGTFGLLATNSIAQGDTRNGGLTWISTHGGSIFNANRRYRWPGQAAVIVSIVHVYKGLPLLQSLLDGRPVQRISAYLFDGQSDLDPSKLAGQNDLFSQGTNIAASGFLIGEGEATSIEEMRELLKRDSNSECRIIPYMGGREVNQNPTQTPHRYTIYLSDLENEQALNDWQELTRVVKEKVRPQREILPNNALNNRLKRRWWTYHADRFEFYRSLDRVLVTSRVGNAFAFSFVNSSYVLSEQLVLFHFNSDSAFAVMQSRAHEVWGRFFSSTFKDDLRYAPSDCFETFPFPIRFETYAPLESAGLAYYGFRGTLMERNEEGLTKTYNRFHDPDERSFDILKLRELHAALDRAVLDAYGWTDLAPICEFLLDYEEDDEDESESVPRRKKPWRYRWPDDFRDEVLARLLELNRQRAEEERLTGAAASGRGKPTKRSSSGRKTATKKLDQPKLFED